MAAYDKKEDRMPEGYSPYSIRQYTPEQANLFNKLFRYVRPGSFTSRLAHGRRSAFHEMEEPAMEQYGDLLSGMGARFGQSGMAAKSAPFRSGAASDFLDRLKSSRHAYRQQALQDLMGMSSELLKQRPYERGLVEGDPDIEYIF